MNEFNIKRLLYVSIKAVKSVFIFIITVLTDFLQSEKESQKAYTQQMQQQQQTNYIQSLMYALANDLFYVLHGRNYYFIRAITAVADIRSLDYQEYNGQFIFTYELTKTTQETVASTILNQVRQDINADIAQAHHNLISVYGEQTFVFTYPFLFHGIKVVGILDTGTAIRIEVVSNYMP